MSSNPNDPSPTSQAQTTSPSDDPAAAQARIAELEQQLAEPTSARIAPLELAAIGGRLPELEAPTDQEKAELGRTAEAA